jgi:DNA invertase Pin-like site-specific DNA recombinase
MSGAKTDRPELAKVLRRLAEFERELILARTSDGRTRAKAKGVRFGRPPS